MRKTNKLSLRNIIIWVACLLVLAAIALTFMTNATASWYDGITKTQVQSFSAIWVGKVFTISKDGIVVINRTRVDNGLFILPLIGVILAFLSLVASLVISFVINDKKLAKILLVPLGILTVVGGIFVLSAGQTAVKCYAEFSGVDVENIREFIKDNGNTSPGLAGIIVSILLMLAGVTFGVSAFLPDKKLGK